MSSQALSEHGQAEGKCESTLLPTKQPKVSKLHESQGEPYLFLILQFKLVFAA